MNTPQVAALPGMTPLGLKPAAPTPRDILLKAEGAALAAVTRIESEEGRGGLDCGFAWVQVTPARGPFINWCKAQIKALGGPNAAGVRIYGSKHWESGWLFWSPGRHAGQSVHIHLAGARAFAEVLREYGITARAYSRLD